MSKNTPLYEVRKISDLKDMLNQTVALFGSKTAFLIKKEEGSDYFPVSYSQFKEDVDSLGTSLINLNLKDKKIALIGENRYEWAVSYLAIVNGTGIVVPIDKELPENEIENLLERSEASAIIYSKKFNETMKKISQKNTNIKFYIGMDIDENHDNFLSFKKLLFTGKKLIENGEREFLDAVIDPEKMSILLFTSGTTDLAKAVMLSHKNICSNLMDVTQMIYLDEKDTFLSFLPLHHTYECTAGFLTAIYKGATIAYCEGLKHIVKNLKESKATVMVSVPLVYESMYKRIWDQASKKPGMVIKMKIGLKISNFLKQVLKLDLTKKIFKQLHETLGGHVRIFISGAAALDPTVAKGFRDFGILLLQGYGLTECSPIVTVNRDVYFKDGSAGLPLPSVEVKIEDASPDGIGEIVVKGPNVMLGYYKNEEATSKVFKNGWFYTGDLGYIDKDGFVYITGRKKNVIVTKNGKNIFPEELETLLNRSPYIKESLIWGKPDKAGDTLVCAIIVINKEFIQEKFKEEVSNEQIYNLINQEVKAVNKKLPLYKHIREFTIREEELIKTTTKKVKRHLELKNNCCVGKH